MIAWLAVSLFVVVAGSIAIWQWIRLTRLNRALTLTLENVSHGIMMVDTRRRMPVVNRRVGELLGLPAEIAAQGGGFDRLMDWQERQGEFRPDAAGIDGDGGIDPSIAFHERTRTDGTVLEIRTTVLSDGTAVRTFTDVTERKRIQRELTDARDAAQAGIRARTEILAVMSHEIRTPMNGIIGAAGLLRDMGLDAEQLEFIRIIRESSEHLSSLIQDILDFSRLDAGRLELEEITFEPRALIAGTIGMLSGQLQEKGLGLVARADDDVPAKVTGDPSRLRQILINLIGNAIKFTAVGGITVNTRMSASDEQSVTLSIAVTDSGIGIDSEAKQKLFSAFVKKDSTVSHRFGGAGLGLAICKNLVTLMGGTIDVDSVPGHGSTFRFSIHLRRAPAEQETAADTPPPAFARGLKVLLAEDNATNRHVATRMLMRMGHEVDAVEDGGLAAAAAAAKDYDVILMDMMMPEVDGLTATRMIRAGAPPRSRVRIVGLTANAAPSDRAACEAAGMNRFVTKPITLERLQAVLDQTMTEDTSAPDRTGADDGVALDTQFLSQLAGDVGPECVAEMIRIFLEDAPARMAAIRRATTEGSIQTIRREAHALSGAAFNVGLTRLGEVTGALQKACEKATPDKASTEIVAAALQDSLPLVSDWAAKHAALVPSGM